MTDSNPNHTHQFHYDPDCPPGMAYALHNHQIAGSYEGHEPVTVTAPTVTTTTIDKIMKEHLTKQINEQLYRPSMISKLLEAANETVPPPDLHTLIANAVTRNYHVHCVNRHDFNDLWMEGYERDQVMSIYQPLSDAGYENFVVESTVTDGLQVIIAVVSP
jgi:hypothetical protein